MIYDISYKTLTGSKPLGIRFDKIDRIIRIYDGTRYITLLGTKKYGAVYDRIRFRISLKSNMFFVSILHKSKLVLMILMIFAYTKNPDFA